MGVNTENLEPNQVGLISQAEDGTIFQIGLTSDQSKMLNIIVATMSKEKPLVRMDHRHLTIPYFLILRMHR